MNGNAWDMGFILTKY